MRLADAAQISKIIQANRMGIFRADILQSRKQQIIHRTDLLFAVRHAAQNLIAARCHAFAIHFYRHGSAANIHEQVKF